MNDLEKSILRDLHDYREGKRKIPTYTEYNLKYKGSNKAKYEYAHYLLKLKDGGYLNFIDKKVIIPGGIRDETYMISVSFILTENIKITDRTKKMFEPKTSKMTKVLKDEGKGFIKEVNSNVRSYFAKWVAGLIILGIILLLLKVL